MPDWNTLTSDMVRARFSTAEAAAYNVLQGGDSLTPIVQETTDVIRGKIKAGGGQRGPDGTIPNSLKTAAISISIWLWITGNSRNDKLQTDGRKANYNDAMDMLKKVATGEERVELPDVGETDATASPVNAIQQASGEKNRFKRHKMRGL